MSTWAMVCVGADLKHSRIAGEGSNGQSEKDALCGAAQPRAQFVQLEVRDVQVA